MAIGQMLDGSGSRDMLASQCKCTQCGQDLSAMSYERRVAHIKRCEPAPGKKAALDWLHDQTRLAAHYRLSFYMLSP